MAAVLAPPVAPVGPDLEPAAGLYSASSLLGQRPFGAYELLEEIARGGMGVVFKARQRKPDRLVAIKVIAAGELASPKLIGRFRAETEAAASLEHPNIVPIYEVGEHGGFQFFSMRLVEGRTLGAALSGRPMDPRRAAELLVSIARAVHYAHQRGILHRDLKPTNILLDAQGQPHLTDFGLAKVLERDTELTLSGAILGTPSYMAPEQAAGHTRQLTTAADVYGLGAVFFEMLTGRPPFAADSSLATVRLVLDTDPPRPSTLQPGLPIDLETLCLKCLEKEPARRYGSAEALANDLERWLRHEPIQARPGTPLEQGLKWVQRNPARAGLLLTLLLCLIGVFIASTAVSFRLATARNAAEHHRAEAQRSEETSRRRLVQLNLQTGERLLQDMDWFGAQLWFLEALKLVQGDAIREEPIRYLLESARRRSPQLRHLWWQRGWILGLEFSPSGDRVATLNPDGVTVRDVATGRQLLAVPGATRDGVVGMLFAPDGSRLITGHADGAARVWNTDTGEAIGDPLVQEAGHRCDVALSPDGQTLITFGGPAPAQAWRLNPRTPTGLKFDHGSRIMSVTFSPDGRRLLTLGANKLARLWNVETGAELVPPLQHDLHLHQGLFSPDGSRLVTSEGLYHTLHVWDARTGEALIPPFSLGGGVMGSVFVRNGSLVASALFYGEAAGALWDPLTGRVVRQFEGTDYDSRALVGSQDSTLLVTTSWDKTVRLRRAASGEYAGPILYHGSPTTVAALSRDRKLLATGEESGTVRLWDLTSVGAASTPLLQGLRVLHGEANASGDTLIAAANNGVAYLFDGRSGDSLGRGFSHRASLQHATLSRDGLALATVDEPGAVRIWSVASNDRPRHTFVLSTNASTAQFSPDGRLLAAAVSDGSVQLWDVATGRPSLEPLVPASRHRGVPRMAFSPDSRRLATGGPAGHVATWDLASGQQLWRTNLKADIAWVSISPDRRRLVAAVQDVQQTPRAAYVYDLESGQPVGAPLRHADGVAFAEFSPDSRRVVTAGEDRNTCVWDVETGVLVAQLRRHKHWVGTARFSPNGRHIVSTSNDRTVLAWDIASGQVLALPFRHESSLRDAFFLPDGKRIVSASDDGLFLWNLPRTDLPLADLAEEVQVAAGIRLDPELGFTTLENRVLRDLWSKVEARRNDRR